jgi:hypothetical protein
MRCDFCSREFTAAKPWQHFCCPQHRDAWHNREKTLARRDAEHDAYAAEVREAEDRINGTITLDLIPIREDEPPLVVKRRKIETVGEERRR